MSCANGTYFKCGVKDEKAFQKYVGDLSIEYNLVGKINNILSTYGCISETELKNIYREMLGLKKLDVPSCDRGYVANNYEDLMKAIRK